MDINNLPEVKVDLRGDKYIVAVVSDQNGNQKTVIRADETCGLHLDIMHKLRKEVKEVSPPIVSVKCIGGGQIRINPDNKTVEIWDFSGSYGREPNRQQTVAMLQNAFPRFKITASS